MTPLVANGRCVVDEYVHLTKCLHSSVNDMFGRGWLLEVALDSYCVALEVGLDALNQSVCSRFAAIARVSDDDFGPPTC